MSSLNQKLQHFNEVILRDAALERDRILESMRAETDKRLEHEKRRLQEQADIYLRKESSQAETGRNNAVSRAVMESRQLLMKTREGIIGKIYSDVINMLRRFTDSEDYPAYLSRLVAESCKLAGEGDIVVYLGQRDLERFRGILSELAEALPAGFSAEALKEDIIGGCKVFNKTSSMVVDNTLVQKLEAHRDSFFEVCDLRID